ncbi:MAG: integrase [Candidatus Bathyarchaeia archaeon]|jgi:intergrase/recombinase
MDKNIDHNLIEFEKWVRAKYSVSYRRAVLCYVKKYQYLLNLNSNLREVELLTNDVKSSVVKSLLLFSKFNGCYSQFKDRLNEYGIKLYRPDSLNAFLRILNASNSNIIQYYNEVTQLLRANERLFAKFLLQTGLRVSEGIASFNLVIDLARDNRLSEYYDENLSCLMHFKYPKLFIRHTKNAFITFISKDFLAEIASSEMVTYFSIRKRLQRNKKSMRFDEFRDYFGTHLVNNGILEIEQNLVCGRIPISIFIRHYWSPKLKELGTRVLAATAKMGMATTN